MDLELKIVPQSYIHQQQTNDLGVNAQPEGVMSQAFVEPKPEDMEPHTIPSGHLPSCPEHGTRDATGTNANNSTISNDNHHHQSPSTSSSEEHQDNDCGGITDAGGVTKTPSSYKFPMLKQYYDFGPWIGRNRKALCLGCRLQTSSSQPDRLLKHLNKCAALSEEDKVAVTELMNERTANKRKKPMALKSKDGSTMSGSSMSGSTGSNTDKNIDEALTRFIIECRIPLKAIHSKSFVEFVRALNPDYRIPSRETITNVLIPGLLNII